MTFNVIIKSKASGKLVVKVNGEGAIFSNSTGFVGVNFSDKTLRVFHVIS